MKLSFLGAARQVTGSCYLLEAGRRRILIDCGMFQERAFLERNWSAFPFDPNSIDALLLTHAHLDHSGLIPKLVREGFRGRVLSTAASVDLADIILSDAAKIQEEDAAYKKKRHRREGREPPHPVVPLYTAADVEESRPLFQSVAYNEPVPLGDGVSVTYRDAGHILGSAMLEVAVHENGASRKIVFSGDVGQKDKPILRDPSVLSKADFVVMESTYGDRDHETGRSVEDQLEGAINATFDAGGNLVVPTFAVERAQELMYHINRLVSAGRIPHVMVFLDSPMAIDVTEVFRRHRECMDEDAMAVLEGGERLFQFGGLHLSRSTNDSKAINRIRGSAIILAGSGMCTAGRIKHHLVNNISRPESTILFVGYQAYGTLGRELVDGKEIVRIHGAQRKVQARIAQIQGLSAHADRSGLLGWLDGFGSSPSRVFLTHGEESAATALADEIRQRSGPPVHVPEYRETVELS